MAREEEPLILQRSDAYNDIHPIHDNAWHIVTGRAVRDIGEGCMTGYSNGDSIKIILTNKDHRKFVKGCEIGAFVQGSCIGGSVSKKAKDDLAGLSNLRRQGSTVCYGAPTPYDPHGPEHANAHAGDLHESPFAFAVGRER
jgi:hypothetical protein